MGVFEEIFDKAKGVADAAGKKTGEIVEISKYKIQVGQINSEIKAAYEKLGGAVYSMVKSEYDNPELINSMAEEIDELHAKLKEAEDKISELKKVVKCPCCATNNVQEASYCLKCGCRLTADYATDAQVEDKIVVEPADETVVQEDTVVQLDAESAQDK